MTERDIYLVVSGRVLLAIREANGLTQIELASRSGISKSAICRYEKGQTSPDMFELRSMVADRERFMRVVEHVFRETQEALKQLRASYTRDELTAVVMLVIGGVQAKDPRWIHLL